MPDPKEDTTRTSRELFLGFDLSTQSLKVSACNSDLEVEYTESVNFDCCFPEFEVTGGMHQRPSSVVTSPVLMWVSALDMLLEKMSKDNFPFTNVVAISGSGQQHGSVYWSHGAEAILGSLDDSVPLAPQLEHCFSVKDSPIWADSSTSAQCQALEAMIGGPEALALATGSRAFERFTASQIMKLLGLNPQNKSFVSPASSCSSDTSPPPAPNPVLAATERVSLVSSFFCSMLLGRIAEVDCSDASGMNLLDPTTTDWHPKAIDALATALWGSHETDLRAEPGTENGAAKEEGKEGMMAGIDGERRDGSKFGAAVSVADQAPTRGAREGVLKLLGPVVPSHAVLGRISPYYTSRFGFSPECKVAAFSGDNPCSVAGLGLGSEGDVAVSLGTSDTLFGMTSCYSPSARGGHVLVNPVLPSGYLAMLCYKNGSLARETVRSWVEKTRQFPKAEEAAAAAATSAPAAASNPCDTSTVALDAVAGAAATTAGAASGNDDGAVMASGGGEKWEKFNALVAAGPPGNHGCVGVYMFTPEITPKVLCGPEGVVLRRGGDGQAVDAFTPEVEARAVVEARFLSMRLHSESLGILSPARIIATGGGSANLTILQVLADVFGVSVYTAPSGDAAAVGAAFRAVHAYKLLQVQEQQKLSSMGEGASGSEDYPHTMEGAWLSFEDAVGCERLAARLTLACRPRPDTRQVYAEALLRYQALEEHAVALFSNPQ